MIARTEAAKKQILSVVDSPPEVALILGSGLGSLAESIENPIVFKSSDLKDYPESTVEGHDGQLIFGEIEGRRAVIVKGRLHYYEGYTIQDVVFPISLLAAIGVERLLVTNAAGGANPQFGPGTLMFIDDHINMGFANPLIGSADDGPRFPDMSAPYDKVWLEESREIARDLGIQTEVGTYFWTPGPSYETKAEVKAYRKMGADAIGMSTVPEVIAATYYAIRVLGISTITNKATGLSDEILAHEDVLEVGLSVRSRLEKLVRGIVAAI